MSAIFDAGRDPMHESGIRLLQADPERYFELFLCLKSKFGFRFDGMSDEED